jgi:enoyl-CoA hydratase/carnithine racemase
MGRAKQLVLLNDRVSPAVALEWGLVNWVVPAGELAARLEALVESSFYASRTAVAESKRLLQESFHRDPRTMVEDMIGAQTRCHSSWELQVANAAWSNRESDVRFFPKPALPQ